MPNLKRKKSDGTWQTITPASDFPAKVPIEVTDADLVPLIATENRTYNPYPHDGYSSVEVDVPGLVPTGNKELTQQSGTDVTNYATASVRSGSVTLNTPTINTSTGVVTASASVGTSGWVGSAPANKTLSLSTQAAKTVTPSTSEQTAVEAGKYTTGAIKVAAMPTATHPAPTASINTSTGVVTASHTQSSGYVTGGTTTGTLTLSTQAAKTVTPSTSEQTAVAAQRYTTGAVTVAAVPTETKNITSNGTYTPTSGKFFSSVSVNVPGGGLPSTITAGDTPIAWVAQMYVYDEEGTYANTGITITIQKAGTYRFKWVVTNESYSNTTVYSRLYKNSSAVGTEKSLKGATNEVTVQVFSDDISCNAGDRITIYYKGIYVYGANMGTSGMLTACINWNPWS